MGLPGSPVRTLAYTRTAFCAPAAAPEPLETARQVGALLPREVGDCLVCDLIKGRGRTQAVCWSQ